MYEAQGLHRIFRDIHAATQHAQLQKQVFVPVVVLFWGWILETHEYKDRAVPSSLGHQVLDFTHQDARGIWYELQVRDDELADFRSINKLDLKRH